MSLTRHLNVQDPSNVLPTFRRQSQGSSAGKMLAALGDSLGGTGFFGHGLDCLLVWLRLISGQTMSRGYDRFIGLAVWLLALGFYAARIRCHGTGGILGFAGSTLNCERKELS